MTAQPAPQTGSERRRAGGGRRGRGAAERQTAPAPAFIERKIPFFDFLSEDQVEAILGEADWMLEVKGIEFRDNPEALRRLADAGANVTDCCVRFPEGLARKLARTCPTEFTQHARNPDRSVRIGGRNQVFASMYGAPFVRDAGGERRYGSMADFNQLAKILHKLPHVHHLGHVICEPVDVPVNKRHFDMVYSHLKYSDKPIMGSVTAPERAQDTVDMCKLVFGADFVDQNCVTTSLINVNSPLTYDGIMNGALRVYAENNQACIVSPFLISGAMAPVSPAGVMTQCLAEAVTGIAYGQMIRPGSPVIFGTFAASMSMASGAPTFGTPEPALITMGMAQLARRMNLPFRSGGSLNASKVPDAQAAYETMMSILPAVGAGVNFMLHSPGNHRCVGQGIAPALGVDRLKRRSLQKGQGPRCLLVLEVGRCGHGPIGEVGHEAAARDQQRPANGRHRIEERADTHDHHRHQHQKPTGNPEHMRQGPPQPKGHARRQQHQVVGTGGHGRDKGIDGPGDQRMGGEILEHGQQTLTAAPGAALSFQQGCRSDPCF